MDFVHEVIKLGWLLFAFAGLALGGGILWPWFKHRQREKIECKQRCATYGKCCDKL